MNTPPTPSVLTPARVVALALIALVAIGLVWLRLSSGPDTVSVPDGAEAGTLILEPCGYTTEAGSYPADCGTLVVPENRADPDSRLIALPVTRIHSRSNRPSEPIFRLEGGPGLTNMEFRNASRFADRHDVVLVGYRGVDGSSVLDCPEVTSALEQSSDFLGDDSLSAYANGFRSCADRFVDSGVDLAGYTLTQRVDDLEAARVALGYGQIDLLSESAGTRTAMIYSWRHPGSIHRSVMIGANPPGHFLWDPQTTDEQLRRYAELCSQDESCLRRGDDLAESMRRTALDIPDRWWFLPIKEGNVRIASFYGLFDASPEAAPISAPMTIGSWQAAAKGDASGLWFLSLAADLAFPESFVWGDLAAVARADAWAAEEHFSMKSADESTLGDPGTTFMWGGGRITDAWPPAPDGDEYSTMRTTTTETLVVSGSLDFTTPPQVAVAEVLPHMPNGHQVVLDGFGHTTDFWNRQTAAGTRLINRYFDDGEVDDSLYVTAEVDFTPAITQTAVAKGIAWSLIGLTLLTVISLLWLPRHVHKRGRVGHRASAVVRSVYGAVLGLGGWSLGVLVVLTTMPGVPLSSQLLATLSIGIAVCLSTYWGWVHRDWTARRRGVGLVAAAAGALVGAGLGLHATDGLLSLVTAILGAVAGSNLTLILLDLSAFGRDEQHLVPDTLSWCSAPVDLEVPASLSIGR